MLSDNLVAEPRLVRDLQREGIAHLPVRVRDGTGLVGPLVIPGVTSCLRCADLHRSDRDPAWPAIAAQLRDTVGWPIGPPCWQQRRWRCAKSTV